MGNLIVLAVIAVIVGFAVRSVIKTHKGGGCGCGCDGCSGCGTAKKTDKK